VPPVGGRQRQDGIKKRVQSVDVTAIDATLTVTVVYVVLQTQQQQTQEFVYGGAQA